MIDPKCFTKEWIDSFKTQKEFKKINPPVLEKMIHAISLLQYLSKNDLKFTFKGGTCLILLLENAKRFSVDIDILTTQSRSKIENILDKIIEQSDFIEWKLDEKRSYKSGVPKAHYEISYSSNLNKTANYVLLDILFEESDYPETKEIVIDSEWIEIKEEVKVVVPTIESILGDKLTAFAPNTTGVPYNKNKDKEIIKQLFDVGCLFDEVKDFQVVANSFHKIVAKEIKYRSLSIKPERVLDDIIQSSILVAKRERNTEEPHKSNFEEIQLGIIKFGSFLIQGKFKIDEAITTAGKAAYIAAKLKTKDHSPLEQFNEKEISDKLIEGELDSFNKFKKLPDKSGFFYWYKTSLIIGK
jgi:predicted nucleotidyltransferase component of viral defense system